MAMECPCLYHVFMHDSSVNIFDIFKVTTLLYSARLSAEGVNASSLVSIWFTTKLCCFVYDHQLQHVAD